jgi:hypothetical protein
MDGREPEKLRVSGVFQQTASRDNVLRSRSDAVRPVIMRAANDPDLRMSQQPRPPAPTCRPRDELHPGEKSLRRDELRAWEAILWQRLSRRRADSGPQSDTGTTT